MKISVGLQEKFKKTGWLDHFSEYFASEEWSKLQDFLVSEVKNGKEIYPRFSNVFDAFLKTPFDQVKCVIIGQDPYYTPGMANGTAFSVNKGLVRPPTLKNIFKELERDIKCFIPDGSSTLNGWSDQGVLLLNSILTVERGIANSHANIGWEDFTDLAVNAIAKSKPKVAFVVWGNYAQKKLKKIPLSYRVKHKIIESAHPSPQSATRGFFGSNPFSAVNAFLEKNNMGVIDWEKVEKSDFGTMLDLPEWTREDEAYERTRGLER